MAERSRNGDPPQQAARTSAQAAGAGTVPGPGDRPEADVVIYDGNCPFCRRQVARLARWDGGQRLAFVSLHDPLVAQRYPDLSAEQLDRQMYVVSHQGKRYGGAAALRYLTRRLPRLWALAPLLHLPFSLRLWQWAYRQVARRRSRGIGDARCDESCELPEDPAGES